MALFFGRGERMIKKRKCPYCKEEMEKNIEELVFKCLKCNHEEEFSNIKLRRINTVKFCRKCKENKTIIMVKNDGFCPNCEELLYTISTIKPFDKR